MQFYIAFQRFFLLWQPVHGFQRAGNVDQLDPTINKGEGCEIYCICEENIESLKLVNAFFEQGASEMVQAQAHTCLDGSQGCLCSFGDFRVCPALEIRQFDYHALFGGYFHEGGSHLRTLERTPYLVPYI